MLMTSAVLIVFSISIASFQLTSCSKAIAQSSTTTCDVKGTYSGTGTDFSGNSTTLVYTLSDNNFAV